MTPELLRALIGQSAGVGVGIFIGALIGLSVRRRNGASGMLFRDSILATAFLAGAAAMGVMMVINYFRLV